MDQETEAFIAYPQHPIEKVVSEFGGRAMGSRGHVAEALTLTAARSLLQCLDAARRQLRAEIAAAEGDGDGDGGEY